MSIPNGIPARITAMRGESLELLEYGWGRERIPQLRIELNRGPRHGIHNGYYGYIIDQGGRPVRGSRFIVKHKGNDSTYGYIHMKAEHVRGKPNVVVSKTGIKRAVKEERCRLVWLQGATGGGYRCKVNKGSWDAKIDRDWVVTARMGASSHRVEFEIDRVTQTETQFHADEGMDQLKSYTDWKLERKR